MRRWNRNGYSPSGGRHPYAVDPDIDYSKEPTTLVEVGLEAKAGGTLLIVTESGFDAIPKGVASRPTA